MFKYIHSFRHKISGCTVLKRIYLLFCRLFPVHISYELNRSMMSPYSALENENKIIFIHIPKAAGNAVVKSLYNESATGHDPLSRYASYDELKFKSYFKFAVVRNPWDRMVSSYHYLKQGGIGFFDEDFAKKYLEDISDFQSFIYKIKDDSNYRKKIMSGVHFVPQMSFLSINGAEIGVDKVVKLENIDEGYKELCVLLERGVNKLGSDNHSIRSKYQDYYTPETIDIVRNLYSIDIEVLGYKYGDKE